MIKRVVGGLVALVVGGTAAHSAYAGHGKAGSFCDFTVQQNNAVMDKLNNESTTWADGNATLLKAASDLRARDTKGVKPAVLAAAENVAATMVAQARATSAAEDSAAASAYNSALQRLATACNTETGQSVKVEPAK
jgi:hypothetical protein